MNARLPDLDATAPTERRAIRLVASDRLKRRGVIGLVQTTGSTIPRAQEENRRSLRRVLEIEHEVTVTGAFDADRFN